MRRKHRRYSEAEMEKIKALRADQHSIREIAAALGRSRGAIRNIVSCKEILLQPHFADGMPGSLKPWPPGVNFAPDEMQVRT